ncbi:MAG: hypothetical protein JWM00_279 [Candidatus Saccharibacteria bacterium]|nr:hypothetical protein [Candidatus Saccharibacteria bacterium]
MSVANMELSSSTPEQMRRDLVAATIENDLRDAYKFSAEVNGHAEGFDEIHNQSTRLQGEQAAELVDVIEAGGDEAETAKSELAGLEGQAFGFRLASAKYAVEGNARLHDIDYLGASYDEIGDDNVKMLTDQFAHTMERTMATNQYSDKRKESWNFPGFASKDAGISEQEYATAVENAYKLASVERSAEPIATESPYTDGKTETVYSTPTKYGFSIHESRISDGTVTARLVIDKKAA